MGKHRPQFTTLDVIEKRADFLATQRSGKPLHIVFHEYLHRGAADRSRAFDSHARAATDGHVRAEERLRRRGGEWANRGGRRFAPATAGPFPRFSYCHCSL